MNDSVDMSQFVEAKSDQLNADDLIGGPRTVTIRRVTGSDGDQPVSVFYEGDNNKPFKPCKTMRRVMLAVWGKYAADYVGRSMTLYRDPEVTFGALATGGIRISHMSHIDQDQLVVVMKTKGKKAGIKIAPLRVETPRPDDTSGHEQARAKAEAWVAEHTAAVAACEGMDALDALIAKARGDDGKGAITKLARDYPDLRETVMDAYSAKGEALEAEMARLAAGDQGEGFGDDEQV